MSNLQTYYHFKLDFQKVDRHAGGKWLIHDTKRRKNSWKAWNSPVAYPSRVCKHDIKEIILNWRLAYAKMNDVLFMLTCNYKTITNW